MRIFFSFGNQTEIGTKRNGEIEKRKYTGLVLDEFHVRRNFCVCV